MSDQSGDSAIEQNIFDAWIAWAQRELPRRRDSADRAYKRAVQARKDEVLWQHAEIMERSHQQLHDMWGRRDPYFARVRGQMQDGDGEIFEVDLRVHRYHRSEVFPLDNREEMVDISHLAPLADLVRNPAQKDLTITVRDKDFYQWPEDRNVSKVRVLDCVVEDIELEDNRVVRMAPRYGVIFEDRVRRRLQQSAEPALDVLADVLDREQNAIINHRDPSIRLIILDGPAGTGKTVVAAHRIAVAAPPDSPGIYLTPTSTLRDYVQPVLPRLGLERQRARALSLVDLATMMWPEFPWSSGLNSMVPDSPWDKAAWTQAFTTHRGGSSTRDWIGTYRQAARDLGYIPEGQFGMLDVAPLLWMGAWARRPRPQPDPEWIIIDEAQAIPKLAYEAIAEWMSPSVSWILAGDLMQQGNQHELGEWDAIQQALKIGPKQVAHLWLRFSYRIPPKIHMAAERLRMAVRPDARGSESVSWHSHAGEVGVSLVSKDQYAQAVKMVLNGWAQKGIVATAILVPGPDRIPVWDTLLRDAGFTSQVLTAGDGYRGGLVLTTLDAVRGLEFDGVLLLEVDDQAYPKTARGARNLYTAMTRARRAVHLFAAEPPHGVPSSWLSVIEQEPVAKK